MDINMSFLDDFAKYIQPDVKRHAVDGDYYGSPLAMIGVSQSIAFQVEKELMHLKKGAAKLEDLALKRDFNDPIYRLFKDKFSTIVLAETLLTVLPNTVSSLNPDFFDGIDDYFCHSSNPHVTKEKIYSHLVFACLACVWQAFINDKRNLPEKSTFDLKLISIINKNNQSVTADSIDIYRALYQYAYPKNLVNFLDKNLSNFLGQQTKLKPASCFSLHGLPNSRPEKLKQRLFHDGSNAPYKLIFNTTPWSLFLHNYKQGNTIDYNKPRDHFPFYAKHPAPSLLWTTLLLIDLHEQLSSTTQGNALPMETYSMNISDLINAEQGELTVDANTENPKPCRLVYQELRQRGTHRFSSAGTSPDAFNAVTLKKPWLLDQLHDDLIIEQASADKACIITLRIPEVVFESLDEPTVLIDIHVFYYHDDLRSTIPCILTEEYFEIINGIDNACLQIELDWDYMNNLTFDPQKTPCLAGLSCDKGKADIVVVFGK